MKAGNHTPNRENDLDAIHQKLDRINQMLNQKFYRNSPSPDQYLLTIDEAADYLGVSRRQVYILINSRKITFREISGRKKFHIKDLDAFMEGKKTDRLPSII